MMVGDCGLSIAMKINHAKIYFNDIKTLLKTIMTTNMFE